MPTTTPPVAMTIVRPPRARRPATPRIGRAPDAAGLPGRKLLSGEVITRSGGTHVPWPPCLQSPYWRLNAPLGSCVASRSSSP